MLNKIKNLISKSKNRKMEVGDVFAVKLPDGRYGTIRILKNIDETQMGTPLLVCTTTYIGKELPSINDPKLREILHMNRFSYNNKPAIVWLRGEKPGKLQFIGNIPLSRSEEKIECNVYRGLLDEHSADDVYMEWRWIHDRENLVREIELRDLKLQQKLQKPQKPKKMMPDKEFWKIIDLISYDFDEDDERIIEPAVNYLSKKSKKDIIEFEEALAYKLHLLDTKEHARNIGEGAYEGKGYFSADGFLYARCAVVAKGKKFYESVLKNPKKMPKDIEFEWLIGIAYNAYETKTGEEFEHVTRCSYETFSNKKEWA